MLDGLLGRGFSSKCKYLIKHLRWRIEIIRKKRSSTIRFLKEYVAEILESGRDLEAYCKAGGVIAETNLSSCYDFVDNFCICVLEHLPVMQKWRECPKESREAISSLVFAAARFADLTELRELRSIFTERYGTGLASFVSQEFAEKIASKHPSMEQKLHLLQDISQEFSVAWDSSAMLEKIHHTMSKQAQPKKSPEPRHTKKDKTLGAADENVISSHVVLERTQETQPIMENEIREKLSISNVKGQSEQRQCKSETPNQLLPRYQSKIPPPYIKTSAGVGRDMDPAITVDTLDHGSINKKPTYEDYPNSSSQEQCLAHDSDFLSSEESDTACFYPGSVVPPARALSLPLGPVSSVSERVKRRLRAVISLPDNSSAHVHPNLPDYDDLATRFAALKGKGGG